MESARAELSVLAARLAGLPDDFDLWTGGFPCQDYSVAGKRGGLAGDRGALWWEMRRIIAELRPAWVVGETVPGLLSSNGGRDFLAIVASLVDLGYGVTWTVLDSQYFGVAQRRRRLFIVGHSGGVPRPEVLALSEGLFGHPAPSREKGEGVAGRPTGCAATSSERGQAVGYSQPKPGDPCHPIAAGAHAPAVAVDYTNCLLGEVAGTLEHAQARGNRGHGVLAQTLSADMYRSGGAVAGNNAQGVRNCPVIGMSVRRLTPRECERLQGFPDDYTLIPYRGKPAADGPRYRALGNSMCRWVMYWLGRRIQMVEAIQSCPQRRQEKEASHAE
jgi:DNA (cytosine-5)-methyltransferase 1